MLVQEKDECLKPNNVEKYKLWKVHKEMRKAEEASGNAPDGNKTLKRMKDFEFRIYAVESAAANSGDDDLSDSGDETPKYSNDNPGVPGNNTDDPKPKNDHAGVPNTVMTMMLSLEMIIIVPNTVMAMLASPEMIMTVPKLVLFVGFVDYTLVKL